MRTRIKEDYGVISRRSIRGDFEPKQMPRELNLVKSFPRIKSLSPKCEYIRFERFFLGRQVQKIAESASDKAEGSGWYQFVFEEDSSALNKAAGYSDKKRLYLLHKPIFK